MMHSPTPMGAHDNKVGIQFSHMFDYTFGDILYFGRMNMKIDFGGF
ncbi:MAG: hypothetical protein P8048_11355 [Calditrichia bacterium]